MYSSLPSNARCRGTDGNRDRHASADLADLGLVDSTLEDHVAHIGDGRDRGALVERVGFDHRRAFFDRYVQHGAFGGGGDHVATRVDFLDVP